MEKGYEDANGSGRSHHKPNAVRKFFSRNVSIRSMTSKTDNASSVAGCESSNSPGSAREPEELEDHMEGSNYDKTEICIACGFPRGSTVCCPVTRRHHGTDELVTSGRHNSNHLRVPSATKSIFAKLRKQFPVSPARHHHQSRQAGGESGSSTARELHPLAPGVEDTASDGADGHSRGMDAPFMGGAGDSLGRGNGVGDYRNGTYAHQLSEIDVHEAGDKVEEAASQEEAGVQYYCYTDENGYTYWYTQELQDSVQKQDFATNAAAALTSAQATSVYYEPQAGQVGEEFSVPAGSYVCEYVDENGQTMYCIYTPEVYGAQDNTAEQLSQAADSNNGRTTFTSATAAARPRFVSVSARDVTTSPKRKTPAAIFASITQALKSRRSHRSRGHVDPASISLRDDMDTDPPAPMGTVTSETSTTVGNDASNPYDNEVEEFMELLDENEKKRFLKERKRLIKELTACEKKERDALAKQRHDGVEVLGREERAEIFVLRNDQRIIKTAQKREGSF
ncbi:hypothetical protein GH5_00906 [Leishmania sp. Ghana 2012 LV757]|uniref:hypothetical protein n=1 Tax=Leishmania sp. Ghana 2012 LV757 TaxID=2803181 RepID=UPI001B5346D0|nr:hypothetical protein GH5_00906 [Leishmania sp. Ghana 2012 LV757]